MEQMYTNIQNNQMVLACKQERERRTRPSLGAHAAAGYAHQRLQALESQLHVATEKLESINKQRDLQTKVVSDLVCQVEVANKEYKAAVSSLHERTVGLTATNADGKAVVPKLRIKDILDGRVSELLLEDEGIFGWESVTEPSNEDKTQLAERKKLLAQGLKSVTENLFGEVRQKAEALVQQHQEHVCRLAKKRRPDAEAAGDSKVEAKDEVQSGSTATPATGAAGAVPAGAPGGAPEPEPPSALARAQAALSSSAEPGKGSQDL